MREMTQNVELKWHLRALHDEAFDSQEVRPFQRFETEVVESVVARVHNCCVETLSVCHHDAVGLLAADMSEPFFGHAFGWIVGGGRGGT